MPFRRLWRELLDELIGAASFARNSHKQTCFYSRTATEAA
jgi:hypothetical protein